jgi:hypothetical protein
MDWTWPTGVTAGCPIGVWLDHKCGIERVKTLVKLRQGRDKRHCLASLTTDWVTRQVPRDVLAKIPNTKLTVMKLMEEIMEFDQEIKMKQRWINARMKLLHNLLG